MLRGRAACLAGGGSLSLGGVLVPLPSLLVLLLPSPLCFSEVLDFVLTFLQ